MFRSTRGFESELAGCCVLPGSQPLPIACNRVSLTSLGHARPHLHRLATVRRLQGMSRRTLARRMNVGVAEIRRQEEAKDLPLSVLYEWHKILEVPMAELLLEAEDSLSQPFKQRAKLV